MEKLMQNACQMILILKSVFLIMKFLSKKNQEKLNVGKVKNYDEGRVLSRGNNVSPFEKPSQLKWGGAKYAGGSRTSCFQHYWICIITFTFNHLTIWIQIVILVSIHSYKNITSWFEAFCTYR